MPALYAAADVVVVPSLIEATSISVLEAMATGRPVVASKAGGLPALIEHGRTGCLVCPGDEADIAARVCDLLADRDRRTRMGQLARRRVLDNFTWDRVAARTIDAYRGFLTCSRKHTS
jgi:glycosyltransferase involved in cell wall biosynthesis